MRSKPASGPYGELFIYYLAGRLHPDTPIDHPDFIGNWEEDGFSFLFFAAAAESAIEKLVNAQPQLTHIDTYRMPYDQWQPGVHRCLTQGSFCITPPWKDFSGHPADGHPKHKIVIDPGVVFGTAAHPTTRDCLQALELAAGNRPPETVLDLGTGTGVLALAAARLGCKKILAVDLNLLAARTAAKNVHHNALQNRVLVIRGRAQDFISQPADLVIANIHYDVMQHLVGSEALLAKRKFILSGLLRGQAKDICLRLRQKSVKILNSWSRDDIWHTFYAMRC